MQLCKHLNIIVQTPGMFSVGNGSVEKSFGFVISSMKTKLQTISDDIHSHITN